MAKLHGISKQTLLYYDSIGLLKPRETDKYNKYRYYTLDQFDELDVIICLKTLGMKLKEIKNYLKKTSLTDRVELLENQGSVIETKIGELKRIDTRLKTILSTFKSSIRINPGELGIKKINKRYLVTESVLPPHSWFDLEIAIKKLIDHSLKQRRTQINDLLVFMQTDRVGHENFKRVALETDRKSSHFLPGGEYAYLYHKGTYETLPESRMQLSRYIRKSGFQKAGDTIEKMLLGSLTIPDETDYLTEIQVLVKSL